MTYVEYSALLVEQHDAVLKVTVNRPHVLNAQSRIMREELDDVLDIAVDDDGVRVVIIAGAPFRLSAASEVPPRRWGSTARWF